MRRFGFVGRMVTVLIVVLLAPASILYVVFGLIKKEKMTGKERAGLFVLLASYLGLSLITNLSGYSWGNVFWATVYLAIVVTIVRELVESIKDRRKGREGDAN